MRFLACAAAGTLIGAFLLAPARGEQLRVKAMTFNIRLSKANDGPNGWTQRADMVREIFERSQADFVGVQEAWPDQIAFLRRGLPQYAHLGRSREADACKGEAVPLFYRHDRWRLDPEEFGVFWLSDTPDIPGSASWGNWIPRIVTWGRFLEKSSGRGIYVFNIHLDHLSETSRVKSAAYLAKRIAERKHADPAIVLGDFNSDETGTAVRALVTDDSPAVLVDTFRVVHPNEASVGTFHAFTGARDGGKIDHILVTPGATLLAAEIVHDNRQGRYPSDHFPVTAEVAFP